MNQSLFTLAWRETVRSAYWGKSLATSIGLGFLALYFSANFLFLGIIIPKALTENFPDNPLSKFNSFVLAYLAFDFLIRQLAQKLPVVGLKPLLSLGIKRPIIAKYLIGRSLFSFFNLLPLFLVVPSFIQLAITHFSAIGAIAWLTALVFVIICSNLLSVYVKWRFMDNDYLFLISLAILASLFALNRYGIVNLSGLFGQVLDLTLKYPPVAVLMLAPAGLLYVLNFNFLRSNMYVGLADKKKKDEKIRDYSWTEKLGETGRFVALELKLIWRNKRPRKTLAVLPLFLLYGFIFLRPNEGKEIPEFVFLFLGIFLTGIFAIQYGQFFPAWHSNYFSMLMCQPLTMKQFLRSFYLLMAVVSVICYLITLPYAFMNAKIIYTNFVMMIYNLGVNIPFFFGLGLFSSKRIDLNQSPMMNYQGMGASQWLSGIPTLLLPMGLFFLTKFFANAATGYVLLGVIGAIGLVIHPIVINFFSIKYQQKKHQLIKNYKNS